MTVQATLTPVSGRLSLSERCLFTVDANDIFLCFEAVEKGVVDGEWD